MKRDNRIIPVKIFVLLPLRKTFKFYFVFTFSNVKVMTENVMKESITKHFLTFFTRKEYLEITD